MNTWRRMLLFCSISSSGTALAYEQASSNSSLPFPKRQSEKSFISGIKRCKAILDGGKNPRAALLSSGWTDASDGFGLTGDTKKKGYTKEGLFLITGYQNDMSYCSVSGKSDVSSINLFTSVVTQIGLKVESATGPADHFYSLKDSPLVFWIVDLYPNDREKSVPIFQLFKPHGELK